MDDIARFYGSIYPAFGVRVLTVQGKDSIRQLYFATNDDLIVSAYAHDRGGQGRNTYHACAVFKTEDSRKADNALAAKALWADLDVGPGKPYSTAKEAAQDLENFRIAAGLEPPHLVQSGRGVHAYFPFTKAITPEQWKRLASVMSACMTHAGVQYDSSRAEDIASVLRVPGTHNYKTDPPMAVTLRRLGREEPVGSIYKKLKDYAEANGVLLLDKPKVKTVERTELMGEAPTYPPSEGDIVAKHCPIIGEVAASGGDTSYDIWWRAMGVAKHTTTPELTAEKWTNNREATGHDKFDWQAVINNWPTGPTTCAEFAKHSTKCRSCPHAGKVTSPIRLGTPEQPLVQPPLQALPAPVAKQVDWSFGAQWIMDELAQKVRVGCSNGQMTMSVQQDDGTYKHVPFVDRYWQVMRRVRTVDNVWALEIGYESYPGDPHKTFLLESAFVTSPEKLKTEFSKHELHIYGGQRAMMKTQDVIRFQQDRLYSYRLETPTYPVMGWVTENNTPRGALTGSFVLGDTLITPNLVPRKVLLDEHIEGNLRTDFQVRGTAQEWAALVDRIYNRPGAEPYQFVIAAMFASPLVRLVPGAGDWHGIPIVLTGESGAAKTSTALAAMTVYAPPQLLRFNAGTKESQGDTITAFAAKVGTLNNIPFIADEMTGVDEKHMAGILFLLANGKPRGRARADGKIITDLARWDVISIGTANDSFHSKLKQLQNSDAADAASLRCFEVSLKESDIKEIFSDISKTTVEDDLFAEQHGAVGREWLQFVVNKREKIQQLLGVARASFKIDENDKTALRFYKDLLMTVEVGARLAAKRGYIKWDIDQMMKWAKTHVMRLRDRVFEHNWDATVSDFIASLHGRTIVTKGFKLGPGRRTAKNMELPLETLTTSTPPVARRAIEDKLFFVTSNALTKWCVDNKVKETSMINEMIERGYLLAHKGERPSTRIINIGGGTPVTRSQAPCWQLDYDVVVNRCGSDVIAPSTDSNVIPFQQGSEEVVTKVVTGSSPEDADTAVSS